MDRISALRNVEDALRAFEDGDTDLETTERRVTTVLRTYATEFADDSRAAYRATGDDAVDGRVVVATSKPEAARRLQTLGDVDEEAAFDVERLE